MDGLDQKLLLRSDGTSVYMRYLPASMRDGQTYAALLDWYQAPMSTDEYEAQLPAYAAM